MWQERIAERREARQTTNSGHLVLESIVMQFLDQIASKALTDDLHSTSHIIHVIMLLAYFSQKTLSEYCSQKRYQNIFLNKFIKIIFSKSISEYFWFLCFRRMCLQQLLLKILDENFEKFHVSETSAKMFLPSCFAYICSTARHGHFSRNEL